MPRRRRTSPRCCRPPSRRRPKRSRWPTSPVAPMPTSATRRKCRCARRAPIRSADWCRGWRPSRNRWRRRTACSPTGNCARCRCCAWRAWSDTGSSTRASTRAGAATCRLRWRRMRRMRRNWRCAAPTGNSPGRAWRRTARRMRCARAWRASPRGCRRPSRHCPRRWPGRSAWGNAPTCSPRASRPASRRWTMPSPTQTGACSAWMPRHCGACRTARSCGRTWRTA